MSSIVQPLLSLLLLMTVLTIAASLLPERSIKDRHNSLHLVDKLRTQIRLKEEELQRAETINRNFERMIQLVNILGQIDTFVSDRARVAIKKLAMLVDTDKRQESRESDEDRR